MGWVSTEQLLPSPSYTGQSIQSRPNWDPSLPRPLTSVFPPLVPRGGTHSLGERVWGGGSQFERWGRHCGTLGIYGLCELRRHVSKVVFLKRPGHSSICVFLLYGLQSVREGRKLYSWTLNSMDKISGNVIFKRILMDSNGFPVQLRVCRLTFRKLARKKRPRRGREVAVETTSLRIGCIMFSRSFFCQHWEVLLLLLLLSGAYIFSLCLFSFVRYFLSSVLRHFKCSVQYRPKALKRSVFVSGVAGKD
jgi:hypothetical protein